MARLEAISRREVRPERLSLYEASRSSHGSVSTTRAVVPTKKRPYLIFARAFFRSAQYFFMR